MSCTRDPTQPVVPAMFAPLCALAQRFRRAVLAARHRGCIVLSGEHAWCTEAAVEILANQPGEAPCWIGEPAPEGIGGLAPAQAHTLLGREVALAICDLHAGFDPEALGAVSGAVRAGGLLLLLTPPLAQWPAFEDPQKRRITVYPHDAGEVGGRFLQRAAQVLGQAPGILRIEQGAPLPPLPTQQPSPPVPIEVPEPFLTGDQQSAVAALLKVVQGQRRRPVVLTSDRGRGKSSALGIAAAQLLLAGCLRIAVTAPRLDAVAPLFEHAGRLLPGARRSRGVLQWERGEIRFYPPDALLLDSPEVELLLVDEAAAIPAPLLERMVIRYSRIAFATTVHGYEGTGRGFAVRFNQVLDRRSRGWHAVRLSTPVRWAEADPLEALTFRLLLLDAAPAPAEALEGAGAESCTLERLSRDAVRDDEQTLSELFGLLVLAHYRTTPLDLRHLLDGPNIEVWVARERGHVAATALVAREGDFDDSMARQVCAGERRPHGHLLPESLAAHLGLCEAPRLRAARVIRIAVHPAVQGRGIGSRLLTGIADGGLAEGLDYLGTSFGVTPELLTFWERNGYRPVRVSVRRGAASGAHSVLMLRALSAAGEVMLGQARGRYFTHLPHQLADSLQHLEPELALALLRRPEGGAALRLSAADWADVTAFAYGRRLYESALGAVWNLVVPALMESPGPVTVDAPAAAVLVLRVLQRRDWAETARQLGLAGREVVVEALREALRPLIERYREGGIDNRS